jgi:predicted choloylglycine hydrolase
MGTPGCTISAIRMKGRYLLASNSDNPWDTRTKVIRKQGMKFSFIGTELICPDDNLPWSNMMTRGINEKGISFTFAYVDCHSDLYQGGIGFKEFGDHILGSFQALHEIEDYLRMESVQVHGNFLFADDLGNLLVSEIYPTKKNFEWNPEQVVIRTNHFLNLPLANDKEIIETCSILRYQSGLKAINEGDQTDGYQFVQALLRNHYLEEHGSDWGASTCNHGETVGTVSSEILDPLNKEMFYCYGPPCGNGGNMNGWGHYVSFNLNECREGEITTLDGKILHKGATPC